MRFDATITLGSILTLGGCVITLVIGLWHFSRRIDQIEWRSELMWKWFQRRYGINGEKEEK